MWNLSFEEISLSSIESGISEIYDNIFQKEMKQDLLVDSIHEEECEEDGIKLLVLEGIPSSGVHFFSSILSFSFPSYPLIYLNLPTVGGNENLDSFVDQV